MFLKATKFGFFALCAKTAFAVQPMVIEGTDFVNSATGNRFQIIGVAYQPGGSSAYDSRNGIDPLSDGHKCLRDAAIMQRLGINTIRVYNVNPDLNHDVCASIFNVAGIYMLLDVNSPTVGESINRDAPWTTYTDVYLSRTFAVVEAFKKYPNTLAFFAGNEVIDDYESSINAPYMRAVTRDLKSYITRNSDRYIPVGYSAADVRSILLDTWNYLQCTTTGDMGDASRVDLFALNSYSWCGNATFQSSGYNMLTSAFANSSVPVFLSEYGCNEVQPRAWTEIAALYGEEMTATMTGGVIYEWTQEDNDYGLVELAENGDLRLMENFNNLQIQLELLDFVRLEGSQGRNLPVNPPNCEASLIESFEFPTNFTLPATPGEALDLIENGLEDANRGRLVTLTSLMPRQRIVDSNGNALTGLVLEPMADDEINTPTRMGNGPPTNIDADGSASSGESESAASANALMRFGSLAFGIAVVILQL